MSLLTRDLILAKPLPTKSVNVPDWGGEVLIRPLTASEVAQVTKSEGEDADAYDSLVKTVRFGVCDEKARSLFKDDDLDAIRNFTIPTLDLLANEIFAVSGVKKTAVEEAEKNSGGDRTGSSPSGSPVTSV